MLSDGVLELASSDSHLGGQMLTGSEKMQPKGYYLDVWSHHYGYCNACGEEAEIDTECCEDGEVVFYDDDSDAE